MNVKDSVIIPSDPEARTFMLDWNKTQETIGHALYWMGMGLAELNDCPEDLWCAWTWLKWSRGYLGIAD